jgi:hypothetical protein
MVTIMVMTLGRPGLDDGYYCCTVDRLVRSFKMEAGYLEFVMKKWLSALLIILMPLIS